MKAGFGRGDITPEGGKIVIAGAIPVRYTDIVHDRIQAVAMVLRDGSTQTIWVGCDMCHPTKRLTEDVISALQKVLPSFREDQLILSATHATACFFLTDEELLGPTFDVDYSQILPLEQARSQVVQGIVNAVMQAYANMEECTVEYAVADILTGYCRRVVYRDGTAAMYGNVNREDFLRMEYGDSGETQILYFYKEDSRDLLGIFAAVPSPAQADENSTYITGDYWAVIREVIWQALGESVEVLGVCRSAGELTPHKMIKADQGCGVEERGYVAARRIGERIAYAIIQEKNRSIWKLAGNELYHNRITYGIRFPLITVTEEMVQNAKRFSTIKENFDETGKALNWREAARVKRVLAADAFGQTTYEARVSAMCLGKLLFYTTPCELFTEYAKRIQTRFADNPVIDVQLTNDSIGYLPTAEAVQHGGYSADIDSSATTPAGGEELVARTVEMLTKILKERPI